MKNLIILFILTTVGTSQLSAQSDKDQFTVQVDGLGCPFCAYGLEKKFKELKGVSQVKIDMETGVMTFQFPSDSPLSEDIVEKQVELAGYTPMWLEVKRADGTTSKRVNNSLDKAKDVVANSKAEMTIYGKCSMCKKRIEKTAIGVGGVASADWNQKSQVLKISYDKSQVSPEQIERKIAQIGHDTENYKAEDDVYKSLPACCKYKRKKA